MQKGRYIKSARHEHGLCVAVRKNLEKRGKMTRTNIFAKSYKSCGVEAFAPCA